MAYAKQTDSEAKEPFVLKHRIAGAGFLLFFGALVVPWLLGPASDANNVAVAAVQAEQLLNTSPSDIEDELLASIAEQAPIEEEVYISKITPLDSKSVDKVTASQDNSAGQDKSAAQSRIDKDKAQELEAARVAEQAKAQKSTSDNTQAAPKTAQATAQKASRQAEIESELAAALEAETVAAEAVASKAAQKPPPASKPKVEIGWVVQVGLFENRKGAQKVVQDLKSKGFTPSVTVVDTNRGKATGTRVWLGPFAQRVDAAKTMSRLADQTGEAGFIRAYP
ncbi:MAG: cell division septation protein DedD [Cryomorphaceae bacterium]|jgi:cell division septation protein DedD